MIKVLYEDNHLIAVFKPAGVLVQPASPAGRGDRTGDRSLFDEVKDYLKNKYHKPGNVFLGLVHRLDRPVSGIVLFAKTSKGASRISEQFRNHEIEKIYQAVVVGKLKPAKGVLRQSLVKNEDKRMAVVSEDGKESELYYETVKSNDNFSLVKIQPSTGRFHQIRVQLSEAGHPIIGDVKYGIKGKVLSSKEQEAIGGGIALCATELTFQTATTGEMKTIKIEHPKEWDKFLK